MSLVFELKTVYASWSSVMMIELGPWPVRDHPIITPQMIPRQQNRHQPIRDFSRTLSILSEARAYRSLQKDRPTSKPSPSLSLYHLPHS